MAADLESIHSTHDQQQAELTRRHSQEVEKFRAQIEELKNQIQSLEESRLNEVRGLRTQIEALKVIRNEPLPQLDTSTSTTDQLQELSENLQRIQEEVIKLNVDNGTLRSQLTDANEKIECLEETLQGKREEVRDRDQTLEQYQDTIQELRTELMQLQQVDPDPTDCNKKGNSLFAEVVDQRQQVVQVLGAQNRSFKEMKRAYRQSEAEIRQLKEENSLMVREIGKIKSIFLSANRTHATELNKRIGDLKRDLERAKGRTQFLEAQVKDGQVAAVLEFFR